jgi:hypothetical protein
MKSKNKIILMIVSFVIVALIIITMVNSYFGWYGYEKWKERRATYGNKAEAIERNIFVKDLQFLSSNNTDSTFNVYIEKGFKYGYHNSESTRMLENDSYPFQITFTDKVGLNYINYYIINKEIFDSVGTTVAYLKKPVFQDTLLIGIHQYTKQWDSIGFIKVWEAGAAQGKNLSNKQF